MSRKKRLMAGAASVLAGIAAQFILGFLTEWWVSLTGLGAPPAVELPGDLAGWIKKAVLLAVLVPLAEEWVFRGFLYGKLKEFSGPIWAGAAVTVLFTAAHRSMSGLPAYLIFGLCAWRIREKTGLVRFCVLFHGAYNACALAAAALL